MHGDDMLRHSPNHGTTAAQWWWSYAWMYLYMCVRACTHACACACMLVLPHIRMHACVYLCMYVCTYVRMYGRMYVCTHVCMRACLYVAGADPAFGQGGGCKNNGTQTFAAAIANISDHVHAPKQAYRSQNEWAVIDSDCTSWMPEVV